jgi:hypothetical protein
MAAAPVLPATPVPTPESAPLRRGAHPQHLHRTLENFHRPAPQRQLVGTVAVDLHLLYDL